MSGVEDFPKRMKMLREFGIRPIVINFARVDEFCPVIVEMCGLRNNNHSGTKNYKLPCLKAKQETRPFLLREEVGRCKTTRCFSPKKHFFTLVLFLLSFLTMEFATNADEDRQGISLPYVK